MPSDLFYCVENTGTCEEKGQISGQGLSQSKAGAQMALNTFRLLFNAGDFIQTHIGESKLSYEKVFTVPDLCENAYD